MADDRLELGSFKFEVATTSKDAAPSQTRFLPPGIKLTPDTVARLVNDTMLYFNTQLTQLVERGHAS